MRKLPHQAAVFALSALLLSLDASQTFAAAVASGPMAPVRGAVSASEGMPLNPVDAARAIWKAYAERTELDPRTDLLHLEFRPGNSSGAVAVSGTSADRSLLAGFFAELSASGVGIESSVEEVPNADQLKRLTWAVAKTPWASLSNESDALQSGRTPDMKLPLGSRVQILINRFDGLLLVKTTEGRVGWVRAEDFAIKNDIAIVAWNRKDMLLVTALDAEVRDPDGRALMKAPFGAELPLEKKLTEGGWSVILPSGGVGMLSALDAVEHDEFATREENLRRESPAGFRRKAAESAQKLVSARWSAGEVGMTLPQGAYRLHDLILPSDADRLARLGAPLSGGKGGRELKPGDLVFFGENGRVRHAGVWLGQGRFAADDPKTGRAGVFAFSSAARAEANGGLGPFLWAVRLEVSQLANPCMLSIRSHPFNQAPPAGAVRCRLR